MKVYNTFLIYERVLPAPFPEQFWKPKKQRLAMGFCIYEAAWVKLTP